MVAEVPVISLRLYTKWSKIVKTGGKLESQGFSFFTVVKISTTFTVLHFSYGLGSLSGIVYLLYQRLNKFGELD